MCVLIRCYQQHKRNKHGNKGFVYLFSEYREEGKWGYGHTVAMSDMSTIKSIKENYGSISISVSG